MARRTDRPAAERPYSREKNCRLFLEACPDAPHPGLPPIDTALLTGELWPDGISLEFWVRELSKLTFEQFTDALARLPVTSRQRLSGEHYDEPLAIEQALERAEERLVRGEDGVDRPFKFRPSHPTDTVPGSPERITVLEERVKRGLALWHPRDTGRGEAVEKMVRLAEAFGRRGRDE